MYTGRVICIYWLSPNRSCEPSWMFTLNQGVNDKFVQPYFNRSVSCMFLYSSLPLLVFWVFCDCCFLWQVVVPSSYRPKSGALFKARALQYCLEEDVNLLADTDWIVHLDEETLATEAAIRGILNFVIEGRHQFGQVSGLGFTPCLGKKITKTCMHYV